ncbi:MAG: hypothetical protein ACRDRI_08405 [Pseudonocardiaceae bacterium]
MTDRVSGERSRVTVQGRCTDGDCRCTLIVIHELGGSWAIHGLGAPGVRLSRTVAIALAEAILAGAGERRTPCAAVLGER